MANVNEIFLTKVAQSLGVSFDLKNNVIGSQTTPNSAAFNLSQISSILIKGAPQFGVYDETNGTGISTAFSFYFDNTKKSFYFSPGNVFYQAQLKLVASQYIPAVSSFDIAGEKFFNFYLDYSDFVLANQIYTSTVVSVNGLSVVVNQLPDSKLIANLQQASLNGYIVGIDHIDPNTLTIYFLQNVSSYVSAQSTINLIFQPCLKYITTTSSNGTTPPMLDVPNTGIPIAQALLGISSSFGYSVISTSKTFVGFPIFSNPSQYFPTTSAYNAFLTAVNNALASINQIQQYSFESNVLNSFYNYTKTISSAAQSFDDYWHSQPYTPQANFEYGLNFNGLQQTYFDSRFKDLWYALNNTTLTKTLAMFRGDIYGGSSRTLSSNSLSASVASALDYSGKSTLYNGSWSYGVSAVNGTGEYNPNFVNGQNFTLNQLVNNYISWTSLTAISPTPLYFHVYKNVYSPTGYIQQRLTQPFQLQYYPLTDNNSNYDVNSAQGVSTSYFAFPITAGTGNTGIIGGIQFYAYFNPVISQIASNYPLLGIQSCNIISGGSNYQNPYVLISGNGTGASISLSTATVDGVQGVIVSAQVVGYGSGFLTTPTLTVMDNPNSPGSGASLQAVLSQLTVGIKTGTSTSPLGPILINFAPITLAKINNSPTQYALPVQSNNFYTLNANTYYWAVFNMVVPYTLTQNQSLFFNNTTGFSGSISTSSNGINWVTTTTNTQVAKLGFVDQGLSGSTSFSNGVYITGETPTIPSQLRIYVPNLNFGSQTEQDFSYIGINTVLPIQNSMNINLSAYNSITGVQQNFTYVLAKNTARGTSIPLGNASDKFDTILNLQVSPNISSGVNLLNGVIAWSINDFFTIDSLP